MTKEIREILSQIEELKDHAKTLINENKLDEAKGIKDLPSSTNKYAALSSNNISECGFDRNTGSYVVK